MRERRLRWPIAANLEALLRQQTVRRVARRAKYILITLDAGTLIVHLGMSGSLRLLAAGVPPRPHDHWDIELDSGRLLRFHDPRRFGSLLWTDADPLAASAARQARARALERRSSTPTICIAPRAGAPWPSSSSS